ncbi:transcriptional regulator, AraC family [Clostridium sp. DL-VIII]|uniref:AraC family transcriptional regulator n=1 Tax=Clostridium sp. DL-VIII TaxID=641107 RepID=UPI00023AFC8E|nr:AraC family transcriptional regulator [Clostridium sp. DL-VIII]EHI98331.1 transcriptional regulator, AraC family [Clostridium sp. DL-VIII]
MSNTRYLIHEKDLSNFNFQLLYINKSKFENDWPSTRHFHPFMEIFFITDGVGYFEFDDSTIKVNQWDLIIINPNCLHTEKSSFENIPLEYIVLGIDNFSINFSEIHHFTEDDETINNLYKILHFNSNSSSILSYLNSLIQEIEIKDYRYETACKSILSLFLINVLRNNSSMLFIENPNKNLNLECIKVKNYLDTHYANNITLDQLAYISYMNKYNLVHTFTKQIGVSPIAYLINKRIDESKILLSTTNYSIRDIASIVGFSNSSYFSQIFKKQTAVSPRAYRSKSKL